MVLKLHAYCSLLIKLSLRYDFAIVFSSKLCVLIPLKSIAPVLSLFSVLPTILSVALAGTSSWLCCLNPPHQTFEWKQCHTWGHHHILVLVCPSSCHLDRTGPILVCLRVAGAGGGTDWQPCPAP